MDEIQDRAFGAKPRDYLTGIESSCLISIVGRFPGIHSIYRPIA
jgi:hypothetical protein